MYPPFSITDKILQQVAAISEKIGAVDAIHLSRPPAFLRKENRIRSIQASLQIEGNSLTIDQVTSLLNNKRVIGPGKDIIEIKNAIAVYDQLDKFNVRSLRSLLKAHSIFMNDLMEFPGRLRTSGVGIVKGTKITHIAPGGKMVKTLLNDLFGYLKSSKDLALIKSCVFHYELEFIHPFLDGNGRVGRLWQTLILKEKHPVFEFLPIEHLIKNRQKLYYHALGVSDKTGNSTAFIEFMLEVIHDSLEELLSTQNTSLIDMDRLELYKSIIGLDRFSRKDYLRQYKEISTATASRDLKFGVENGLLQKSGDKRMTTYQFKQLK